MDILSVFAKLRWSFRKLSLPIKKKYLVLEVGSGGNPHPKSNVLVERYVSDEHRLRPIEIDDRLVIADAHKLPFRDNLFDYSLAFHVLEHVADPELFLYELSRTSKAGYIETPNVLYERMTPFNVHLLEISLIENKLLVCKKASEAPDPIVSKTKFLESKKWKRLFRRNPDMFHVQYYWQESIEYKILNPTVQTDWFVDPDEGSVDSIDNSTVNGAKLSLRDVFVSLVKKKNSMDSDLTELFVCPHCKGELEKSLTHYSCTKCNLRYSAKPVPDFINSKKID